MLTTRLFPLSGLSLALFAALGTNAYGSLSEQELNDNFTGLDFFCLEAASDGTCISRYLAEETPNFLPGLANPLPVNNGIVGQLGGTRDYDWFSFPVTQNDLDTGKVREITPVYFGCNNMLGYYLEVAPGGTLTIDPEKDLSYQVNYYFAPNATATPTLQSSYVVGLDSCRIISGETIGHMRFQMNTTRVGTYYVRIWGRHIDTKDVTDQVQTTTTATNPDGTTTTTTGTTTRHNLYDQIVAPTADYTLWVYKDRITGAQEPNDGLQEAYPLTSETPTSGQLASMYDQDWYSLNNPSTNTSKKIAFKISCASNSSKGYYVSAYDRLHILQASHLVSTGDCSADGGFTFTINAPETGVNYYLAVTPPTYADNELFTQSDYTIIATASEQATAVATNIDLSADLSISPTTTIVDSPLTITGTVTNSGTSTATNIKLHFTLPTGIGFTSGNNCVALGGSVDCVLGDLLAGANGSVTFTATPLAIGTANIQVAVAGDQTDPLPTNNKAAATATVQSGRVDLALSLSTDPSTGTVGEDLIYKAVVVNNSALTSASNAVLTLQFPSNSFEFLAGDNGCTASNTSVTCPIGTIPFNGGTSLRFMHISPTTAGSLTVTGTVTSTETDAKISDNQATLTTTIATTGSNGTANSNTNETPNHLALYPTVIAPNGGEIVAVGKKTTIRWNTGDYAASRKVVVSLSKDGGTTWKKISGNLKNTGEWRWKAKRNLATDQALIKVCQAKSATGPCDTSDQPFSIVK